MPVINLSDKKFTRINEIQSSSIETGLKDVDALIGDLKKQELSFLLGRNGEGKSTLALQIAGHHVMRGKSLFYYNGELSDYKYQLWLYTQIIGNDPDYYDQVQTKYKQVLTPKEDAVMAIKKWHNKKLWVFEQDKTATKKDINSLIENMKVAREKGCDLFITDNLMTAMESDARNINFDQTSFASKSKDFAIAYDAHVTILCHPTKESEELEIGAKKGTLKKTSISGSNNLANYGDVIIAAERIIKDFSAMSEGCHGGPDSLITVLKDREDGERTVFEYYFSKETKRFYNDMTPEYVSYGWKKYLENQSGFITTNDSPF